MSQEKDPQKSTTSVSLVLGSGGARDLAHIGVIHWLEENGFEIASISGTSIGALVGGIHATGQLDEFESWVRAISKPDVIKILDLSFHKDGLIRGEKIIATLRELTGDCLIEDLDIPYTAVAANLESQKEVWLDRGPLFEAIRASISLPLFFQPARHNGTELVDGGILNPVPIAPTLRDRSDLTVAVNLGGDPEPAEKKRQPETARDLDKYVEKISAFVKSFDAIKNVLDRSEDPTLLEIADRTFDVMQGVIARQQLAAYPPDVEIVIPVNACGILDFDCADEMIELGYERAETRLRKYLQTTPRRVTND